MELEQNENYLSEYADEEVSLECWELQDFADLVPVEV